MSVEAPFQLAPRSVDRVRVIRRSMRCYAYGAIGLIPVLGVGLAVQALQLRRSICRELGESWKCPPIYAYQLVGLAVIYATDPVWGFLGDLVISFTLLGLQSWHLFRSFAQSVPVAWLPGRRESWWGTAFAYAGLSLSLWLVLPLVCRCVTSALSE